MKSKLLRLIPDSSRLFQLGRKQTFSPPFGLIKNTCVHLQLMVSVAVCCSSELPKYCLWETVSFSTLSSLKGATLKNAVMAVMDVLEGLRGEPGLPGLLSRNGKLGLFSLCERLQLKAITAVMAHKYLLVYRGAVICANCLTKWCESQLGSISLFIYFCWLFQVSPDLKTFKTCL